MQTEAKVTSSTTFVCMSAIEKLNDLLSSPNGLNRSDLCLRLHMRYGLIIIVIQRSINPSHWIINPEGPAIKDSDISHFTSNIILNVRPTTHLLMISLANDIFLSSQSRISHSMTFVKLLQGYLSMDE